MTIRAKARVAVWMRRARLAFRCGLERRRWAGGEAVLLRPRDGGGSGSKDRVRGSLVPPAVTSTHSPVSHHTYPTARSRFSKLPVFAHIFPTLATL